MGTASLKVRRKFWPKHPIEWGIFSVTLILMPTIFMYELFTVYPYVWKDSPFLSSIIPCGGVFVFTNMVANFVGLIITDTQVPQDVMSGTKPASGWFYCTTCIGYVPPRSWHCRYCRVCILKRDHHCLFGGCCVGHFNFRFFLMFLIYTFIGTLYCVISDSQYVFNTIDLASPTAILKVGFPAFAYLYGIETLENECCILLSVINLAALAFVTVMLNFHIRTALKGQVTHDMTKSCLKFNLGPAHNIREVLGYRWCIAWAFPLISSPLPRDGMEWDTVEEWKLKCQRSAQKSQ